MLQQQSNGAMYFIFIWIAQSIDSYEGTHTCTHRAHRMCRNAYAITNSTMTTTTMLKWKEIQRGVIWQFSWQFFASAHDMHLNFNKKREHTPSIHTYVRPRPSIRTQPKIVLLFYAHGFPFSLLSIRSCFLAPLLSTILRCYRICRMISKKIFAILCAIRFFMVRHNNVRSITSAKMR